MNFFCKESNRLVHFSISYYYDQEQIPYKNKTERYCIEDEKDDNGLVENSQNQKNGSIIELMTITSFCNEDLCNTGTLDFELSCVLMGITVGFKVLSYFLVDMK